MSETSNTLHGVLNVTELVAMETANQSHLDLDTLMIMFEETLLAVIINETDHVNEYYPGMLDMAAAWWNSAFLLFPTLCTDIKFILENDDEIGYVDIYCTIQLNGMMAIAIYVQQR